MHRDLKKTEDTKYTWRIDDDNIFDIVVSLILMHLDISKDFSILQSLITWFTDAGASNNGPAHKKKLNLRKDESSSGMMRISS